jgi:paraquat-inducible protein B
VEADSLSYLKRGCPVYYKQVKVGSVVGYELSPDSRKVWVHLNIDEPFKALVRTGSRFWNASGVRVRAGLFSGVKVNTESLEAIVAGGIAFATPEGEEMGSPVDQGHHFRLYPEPEDDWMRWSPAIHLKKELAQAM